MNIQFLFENGKGSVVDEYGRSEPMAQLPLESEKELETMQMKKEEKPSSDIIMRETSVKRNYTRYSDQDKVKFFKLLFERCLSVATAATQLGIHVRTAQKWAKQYEKDPESIFEKRSLRLPQPPSNKKRKRGDSVGHAKYRGYHCVYLSSYLPELNPIEQLWSVVKSKVKRNKFLEKETLMTRISEASNSLRLSDFEGIVSHSHKCLDKCRDRQAL
ncbi:hypothetical protein G6F25_003350 [Rhizopus arrhizus]|nr:hypothetical protein G6F27_003887 [Rhizopus arrhizus]KAG1042210.1 hypothetical protein G6F25_003350 [Rhizopus arrhizus]KAG1072735.1 hypothetical protein G6F41_003220 [Rhizopus arrhizus]KAG1101349.1 hypothetical protein G6F39_003365 [Rhizopus arrhizus]KAG1286394.1 hypothetical protein G6F65_002211 [Rhizopus arrhizus]